MFFHTSFGLGPETNIMLSNLTAGSLAPRGGMWELLRYSADRVGGDQTAFWQRFTSSPLTGVSNFEAAIGEPLDGWIADYLLARYADDAVAGVDARYTIGSWNFRSVFGGLGGFPLGTRPLSNGVGLTLTYAAEGGSIYGRFGVGAGSFATVSLTEAGGTPGAETMLMVMRTR